ncbi:MAG: hypothetical protein WA921_07895 [Ahrensia sp.]
MTNSKKEKFSDSIIFDNLLGIMCFGVFAASIMYSNSRSLPEPPRVGLVETTGERLEPNMALLKQQHFNNDFSVREFRVVVR